MNKFKSLLILGAVTVFLPLIMFIVSYVWYLGSQHIGKNVGKEDVEIVKDTVEVRKEVYDTVKIKIYEKVPQIDTKRVEPQPTITKDTLKSE